MRRGALVLTFSLALSACGVGVHYAAPPKATRDARFGFLAGGGGPPELDAVCKKWSATLEKRDYYATSHISYPERDPQRACFTRVMHAGSKVTVGTPPEGCAFPTEPARANLAALADKLDALAVKPQPSSLFPCALDSTRGAAAIKHDAKTVRALSENKETYPYTAIVVPGFGSAGQAATSLVGWLPGEACRTPKAGDDERLKVILDRAARGAHSLRGGVAPVIIVSGAAVHSPLTEAFAMLHTLQCRHGVKPEQVLLEPCADHTHTNLRNSGRWIVALGGRAAYIVTDDGMQADYLQDFSGFERSSAASISDRSATSATSSARGDKPRRASMPDSGSRPIASGPSRVTVSDRSPASIRDDSADHGHGEVTVHFDALQYPYAWLWHGEAQMQNAPLAVASHASPVLGASFGHAASHVLAEIAHLPSLQ